MNRKRVCTATALVLATVGLICAGLSSESTPHVTAASARRQTTFFGPTTIVSGQTLRLDAAYASCEGNCPDVVNVTLLIRSGEATLKQITRSLKPDAATTLTLTAEEAPPTADDQIRRLVVGMVLVDAPQSCNTEAFGVVATAHVIDTHSRRVDLVLPSVKRTCF